MARPRVPLISRSQTLAAALRILDEEGLQALSIRRLAAELGVNGASLYHHFANKQEILLGVVALVFADVRVPIGVDEDWRSWLVEDAQTYRRVLLDHPELVPVLVERQQLGIGREQHEAAVIMLERQGVPTQKVTALIDVLEHLALASVLLDQAVDAGADGPDESPFPRLAAARTASDLAGDELFLVAARAVVDAIVDAAPVRVSPGVAR